VQERARRGSVGERAQHACDVAQRTALAPALRQRPRGLALEVEDHPVVACPQRLPEVEVAVMADDPADRAGMRPQAQTLAHLLAATADRLELRVVLRQAP